MRDTRAEQTSGNYYTGKTLVYTRDAIIVGEFNGPFENFKDQFQPLRLHPCTNIQSQASAALCLVTMQESILDSLLVLSFEKMHKR